MTDTTMRKALERARTAAYDGSPKMIVRGAIEECIRILNDGEGVGPEHHPDGWCVLLRDPGPHE